MEKKRCHGSRTTPNFTRTWWGFSEIFQMIPDNRIHFPRVLTHCRYGIIPYALELIHLHLNFPYNTRNMRSLADMLCCAVMCRVVLWCAVGTTCSATWWAVAAWGVRSTRCCYRRSSPTHRYVIPLDDLGGHVSCCVYFMGVFFLYSLRVLDLPQVNEGLGLRRRFWFAFVELRRSERWFSTETRG